MKGRPDYISPIPQLQLHHHRGKTGGELGVGMCLCVYVCTCMCGKCIHGGPQAAETKNNSHGRLFVHKHRRAQTGTDRLFTSTRKDRALYTVGDLLYKKHFPRCITYMQRNTRVISVRLDNFHKPNTSCYQHLAQERAGPASEVHKGYFYMLVV